MASISSFASGRKGKFIVLVIGLIVAMGIGSFAGKFEKAQENDPVSYLPGDTGSVETLQDVKTLPSGDTAPAVTVVQADGPLTAARRAYIEGQLKDLNSDLPLNATKTAPRSIRRTGQPQSWSPRSTSTTEPTRLSIRPTRSAVVSRIPLRGSTQG